MPIVDYLPPGLISLHTYDPNVYVLSTSLELLSFRSAKGKHYQAFQRVFLRQQTVQRTRNQRRNRSLPSLLTFPRAVPHHARTKATTQLDCNISAQSTLPPLTIQVLTNPHTSPPSRYSRTPPPTSPYTPYRHSAHTHPYTTSTSPKLHRLATAGRMSTPYP